MKFSGKLAENGRKYIIYPSWLILAVTVILTSLIDIPLRMQFLPLLASFVLLGLPHGAVDHLLIPRLKGKGFSMKWLGMASLVYLLLGSLYFFVWIISPVAAFIAFIALTWFHWGEGELYIVENLLTGYKVGRIQKVLEVTVRGGAPMLLPLVAFPEYYRKVAEMIIEVIGSTGTGQIEILFTAGFRSVLLAFYLLSALVLLSTIYRRSGMESFRLNALEICLLTIFFLTVPPILAVGLYFCLWHSLRHGFRYSMLDRASRDGLEDGNILPAVKRFTVDSAPLTALSLLILSLLYVFLPVSASLEGIIGVYLVLISVLTLPHIFFVLFMDRKQGII